MGFTYTTKILHELWEEGEGEDWENEEDEREEGVFGRVGERKRER